MSRLSAAILLSILLAATQAHAAAPVWPAPVDSRVGTETVTRVAQTKIFKLLNLLPIPVQVRIHGDGPSFPQVVMVPAAPSAPVPVPYPNTSMKVQFKKPTGGWSSMFTLKWKSGPISLPFF